MGFQQVYQRKTICLNGGSLLLVVLILCINQQEIVWLYQRFCQLNRTAKGFISSDEFMSVPEFAMNTLAQRLLKMVDGLKFKDFVVCLYVEVADYAFVVV